MNKFESITIDGNIVVAVINGTKKYRLSCEIDYENRTLNNLYCSCPYIEDNHRHCKHMAALMLYLDLYFNDGSTQDMFVHYLAHSIIGVIKRLNELSARCNASDVKRAIVGKHFQLFDESVNHTFPYFKEFENVTEASFFKAFNLLCAKKIIGVNRRNQVYLTGRKYNDAYNKFYAKYSFLIGTNRIDDQDYYYEKYYYNRYDSREYYYGKRQIEVNKGVDAINIGGYFLLLHNNKENEFLFALNKETEEVVVCTENELKENEDFELIELKKEKPSKLFYEFFIDSIKNEDEKDYIRNLYIDGKLDLENFSNYLSKKTYSSYCTYLKNYLIGKAVMFLQIIGVNYYFKKSYNTNDEDFDY